MRSRITIRIITVNLPVSFINAIEKLTGEGALYPSRSELIRVAVREFLIKEMKSAQEFKDLQQIKLKDQLDNQYSSSQEIDKFYHIL